MKIIINSPLKVRQIIKIFHYLKELSTDVNINCSTQGLYAQGMDSAHVSLFEINLQESWFDEYECKEDDTIGINCELFYKVISCIDDNQSIELTKTKEDDKFTIKLFGRGFEKEFNLNTIDLEEDLLSVPEVEYSSDIKINSKDFSDLINQLMIFGADVNIKCGDQIELSTSSEESGTMRININEEDILEYCLEENKEMDIQYSLVYINKFTHFASVNTEVNIHMSENTPMMLRYDLDLDDGEDDEDKKIVNFIRFFLAPKIEDS
tara:strand:- start:16515 stop:17309 length:795 start_codon:yes stop_codon:yes gene_type:complete